MAFEVFQRGTHFNPRKTFPFVSISKGKCIVFSKPCAEYFKDVSYVLFLYDKEQHKIAFKPSSREDGGYAFNLDKYQAHVSASSLLRELKIKDARRIPAVLEDGMIYFKYE